MSFDPALVADDMLHEVQPNDLFGTKDSNHNNNSLQQQPNDAPVVPLETGMVPSPILTMEMPAEAGHPPNHHLDGPPAASIIASNNNHTRTSKRRIRRVGQVPVVTAATEAASQPPPTTHVDAMDTAPPPSDEVLALDTGFAIHVRSKHDERWNAMFDRLLLFQQRFGHTMVPQAYRDDTQLGRWCHYQRVEYWIYQQERHDQVDEGGKAKINEDRIARLNRIGFEWDPQRAAWERKFAKLQAFVQVHGHARVPKGYKHDRELANWVRNQRLERVTQEQKPLGRRQHCRLTADRIQRLDGLGFQWRVVRPTTTRPKRAAKVPRKPRQPKGILSLVPPDPEGATAATAAGTSAKAYP